MQMPSCMLANWKREEILCCGRDKPLGLKRKERPLIYAWKTVHEMRVGVGFG
jgi:hypothetical protein